MVWYKNVLCDDSKQRQENLENGGITLVLNKQKTSIKTVKPPSREENLLLMSSWRIGGDEKGPAYLSALAQLE
jgi:hypothetical protein